MSDWGEWFKEYLVKPGGETEYANGHLGLCHLIKRRYNSFYNGWRGPYYNRTWVELSELAKHNIR